MINLTDDGFTGGPASWYRSTGNTAIAGDGSIAHEYRDPFASEAIFAPIIGGLHAPVQVYPAPAFYLVTVPKPLPPFIIPVSGPLDPPHVPVMAIITPAICPRPPINPSGIVDTPEPSYSLLMGLLLLAVAIYSRRKLSSVCS